MEKPNGDHAAAFQPERRLAARHRTLKGGNIILNHLGSFDCRVRNLSDTGARLDVASQIGIPDKFILVIDHDHVRRSCHVIWRTVTQLGVAFDSEAIVL